MSTAKRSRLASILHRLTLVRNDLASRYTEALDSGDRWAARYLAVRALLVCGRISRFVAVMRTNGLIG